MMRRIEYYIYYYYFSFMICFFSSVAMRALIRLISFLIGKIEVWKDSHILPQSSFTLANWSKMIFWRRRDCSCVLSCFISRLRSHHKMSAEFSHFDLCFLWARSDSFKRICSVDNCSCVGKCLILDCRGLRVLSRIISGLVLLAKNGDRAKYLGNFLKTCNCAGRSFPSLRYTRMRVLTLLLQAK